MPTKNKTQIIPYDRRYKDYLKYIQSNFDTQSGYAGEFDSNDPHGFIKSHPLYLNRNNYSSEPIVAKMYGIKDSDRLRLTDSYGVYQNKDKSYRIKSYYPNVNHWIDAYLRLYGNTPLFFGPSDRNKLSLYDYFGRSKNIDLYKGYDNQGEYMGYSGMFDRNDVRNVQEYARPIKLSDKMYLSDYFGLPNRVTGRWLPEVIVRGKKRK